MSASGWEWLKPFSQNWYKNEESQIALQTTVSYKLTTSMKKVNFYRGFYLVKSNIYSKLWFACFNSNFDAHDISTNVAAYFNSISKWLSACCMTVLKQIWKNLRRTQ